VRCQINSKTPIWIQKTQRTGQLEATAFETDAAPVPEVADEGEPHAIGTEKQTGIKKVCVCRRRDSIPGSSSSESNKPSTERCSTKRITSLLETSTADDEDDALGDALRQKRRGRPWAGGAGRGRLGLGRAGVIL
jgi:hypothetical protein